MNNRTKTDLVYIACYIAMIALAVIVVCWRFANWTANYPQFNK